MRQCVAAAQHTLLYLFLNIPDRRYGRLFNLEVPESRQNSLTLQSTPHTRSIYGFCAEEFRCIDMFDNAVVHNRSGG